jgi:hypothetical protein
MCPADGQSLEKALKILDRVKCVGLAGIKAADLVDVEDLNVMFDRL